MSYFRKPLSGLGGVENCGTDQVWDPNIEFAGLKGQCMPRANYSAAQLVNPNAYPGVVKTAGGGGGFLESLFKGLTAAVPVVAPPPGQPMPPYPQPSSGISTTTLAIGGAAALLLLFLATRK